MRKHPDKQQLNVFVRKPVHTRLVRLAKRLETTQAALIAQLIEEKYEEVYRRGDA